ncbi:MlaA family lipoprotein [Psychromonas sp. MME2]|uniref:MlaA family lipoprotein n=1 Tax=Psychromonas sp. MME2 TaxID=3231033 RepID=UPI00339CB8E3
MTHKSYIHNIIFFFAALILTACSSTPVLEKDAVEPTVSLPKDIPDNGISKNNNPWEGFNRHMYYFNAKADQYVILPVVNGYQWVTPEIVQDGVTNFFSNLGEINTFFNSVLQLKGERALVTTCLLQIRLLVY